MRKNLIKWPILNIPYRYFHYLESSVNLLQVLQEINEGGGGGVTKQNTSGGIDPVSLFILTHSLQYLPVRKE